MRAFTLAIIGSGFHGLSAAINATLLGFSVTLFEQCSKKELLRPHPEYDLLLDGRLQTNTRQSLIETLYNTIDVPTHRYHHAECDSLVLDDTVFTTPEHSLIGIPSSVLSNDVRAIIGTRASIRAYADRIRPVLKVGLYEDLESLLISRFGKTTVETLIAPLMHAEFGAPLNELHVESTLKGLNKALTRSGSLSAAIDLLLSKHEPSPHIAPTTGHSTILSSLYQAAVTAGVTMHFNTRVTTLTPVERPECEHSPLWHVSSEPTSLQESAPQNEPFDAIITTAPNEALFNALSAHTPESPLIEVFPKTATNTSSQQSAAYVKEQFTSTHALDVAWNRRVLDVSNGSVLDAHLITNSKHQEISWHGILFGNARETGSFSARLFNIPEKECKINSYSFTVLSLHPKQGTLTHRTRKRSAHIHNENHPQLSVTGWWLTGYNTERALAEITDALTALLAVRLTQTNKKGES